VRRRRGALSEYPYLYFALLCYHLLKERRKKTSFTFLLFSLLLLDSNFFFSTLASPFELNKTLETRLRPPVLDSRPCPGKRGELVNERNGDFARV
jgi:hypothetical protein